MNKKYHFRWRRARQRAIGYANGPHPFRHQGSADLNLYKLFLEQAYTLLAAGGRLGFIVPSGLYSDHGTRALRELFLETCKWEWLFGFENRENIFPIDSRFKFNAVIVEKGGRTAAIRAAFMRRNLEDWAHAEAHVTPYTLEQVERFSPLSKTILEVQSKRDIEILEKIYSDSVLLGDEGPDGWGVSYATEFHMTNDSSLFPPRPKWEEKGYRPDEYSRWLKGDWRPIEELWAELGVRPFGDGETRCAQPPYDRIPIPRTDIPEGVILAREVDAWIREGGIEDVALPLYEGRMIGQFDFGQKGWVSGKGRGAVWDLLPWERKELRPQYLMAQTDFDTKAGTRSLPRAVFMDVTSATNSRTVIATWDRGHPCGHKSPTIVPAKRAEETSLALMGVMNSFAFDFLVRCRLGGNSLIWSVLDQIPVPTVGSEQLRLLADLAEGLSVDPRIAVSIRSGRNASTRITPCDRPRTHAERLRARAIVDTLVCACYGLDLADVTHFLRDCDRPVVALRQARLDPKGFWRIDKEKDPELRHTVLTIVAYHALQDCINACDGDSEKGIRAFLSDNDGEGWMLPETLRLADYGLGHDERAKQHQPVTSRLGPRFFDWQLEQDAEESWRECHLHARNLLGEKGYEAFVRDIGAEERGAHLELPTPVGTSAKGELQQNLFV